MSAIFLTVSLIFNSAWAAMLELKYSQHRFFMAQDTTTSSTDLLIRFLHIVIILSFTGAYLTGDAEEWHQVHMAFGYTLGINLILRILWQFFAPRLAYTQPSGVSRRFHLIKPFVQRYWAQPQQ
jgi:cytochrome b